MATSEAKQLSTEDQMNESDVLNSDQMQKDVNMEIRNDTNSAIDQRTDQMQNQDRQSQQNQSLHSVTQSDGAQAQMLMECKFSTSVDSSAGGARSKRDPKPTPQFIETQGPLREQTYKNSYDALRDMMARAQNEANLITLPDERRRYYRHEILSLIDKCNSRFFALQDLRLAEPYHEEHLCIISNAQHLLSLMSFSSESPKQEVCDISTSETTDNTRKSSKSHRSKKKPNSNSAISSVSRGSTASRSSAKAIALAEAARMNVLRTEEQALHSIRSELQLAEEEERKLKEEMEENAQMQRLRAENEDLQRRQEEERIRLERKAEEEKRRHEEERMRLERKAEVEKLKNEQAKADRERLHKAKIKIENIRQRLNDQKRDVDIKATMAKIQVLKSDDVDLSLSELPTLNATADLFLNRDPLLPSATQIADQGASASNSQEMEATQNPQRHVQSVVDFKTSKVRENQSKPDIGESANHSKFKTVEREITSDYKTGSTSLNPYQSTDVSVPAQMTSASISMINVPPTTAPYGARTVQPSPVFVPSLSQYSSFPPPPFPVHTQSSMDQFPSSSLYRPCPQYAHMPPLTTYSIPPLTVSADSNLAPVPSLRHEAPEFVPRDQHHTSIVQHGQYLVKENQRPAQVASSNRQLSNENSPLTVRSLADALALSRVPAPKPDVFKGDPLAYPAWIAAFEHMVASECIPPKERMLILRRHVDGAARDAINDLYFNLNDTSYNDALEILKKRFGEDFAVAQSFREKLDCWANVKNRDDVGLRAYADFLKQSLVISKQIKGLAILDDPYQIKMLAHKLPDSLCNRWSRQVHKTKKKTGEYPQFKEFVDFVQEEADIMSDTVYGAQQTLSIRPRDIRGGGDRPRCSYLGERQPQKTLRDNRTGENGASLGQNDKPTGNRNQGNQPNQERSFKNGERCLYCEEPHDTAECKTLLTLPLQQRKEWLRQHKLCYACCQGSHQFKGCLNKKRCVKCGYQHPTVLHDEERHTLTKPQKDTREDSKEDITSPKTRVLSPNDPPSHNNPSSKNVTTAQTNKVETQATSTLTSMFLPVYLSTRDNPEQETLVYALLDSMSDTSYVVEAVAMNLGAEGEDAVLKLTTLTSTGIINCTRFTGFRVRAYHSSDYLSLPHVYSRPEIQVNESHIPTKAKVHSVSHLRHLSRSFCPLLDAPVGLLIGYNCSEALRPLEVIAGPENLPYAVKTRLGWSMVGRIGKEDTNGAHQNPSSNESLQSHDSFKMDITQVIKTKDATVEKLIRLMEREFICVDDSPRSQEDDRFLHLLRSHIKMNDEGHYEMPLPFKGDNPSLPNNRHIAYKRAMSLKRQFERDPSHFELYSAFMNEMLERGDAERVPISETFDTNSWYIPHHGVYNPNKPGRVRVVFDCSSQCQGTCLNDHLLQGPDQINPLIGVLCRFRMYPVAVSCDVEKMFYNFHVTPAHRNFLRFLWWPDGDLHKCPVDFRMKVHLFGATSSPGCANFALKQLAKDHAEICPAAAEFMQRDFYIDDGLQSTETVHEAVTLIQGARQICKKGKLRLHKISSNDPAVLAAFPESETTAAKHDSKAIDSREGALERALGLQWSLDTDTLQFVTTLKDKPLTRRGILSVVASIFDPLGLISPIILPGKLILQEMCRRKLGWDDPLPADVTEQWNSWLGELVSLRRLHLPRCYFPPTSYPLSSAELHHFSDASTQGYGQCSYLRAIGQSGDVITSLVMAKSRVAPLRNITVPRLELQAAVLAVKTSQFLQREFGHLSLCHYFWTDSKIVLGYIYNETKRFHVFVANRVEQIKATSRSEQWHHVATENNPADHASRGLSVDGFLTSDWQAGPAFLRKKTIEYADPNVSVQTNDVEVKCFVTSNTENDDIESEINKYSSFHKLINVYKYVVGWFLRWKNRKLKENEQFDELQLREYTLKQLIKGVQNRHFPPATRSTDHTLKQLSWYNDLDNILRVGGRLDNAAESHDVKHPVILPRNSHLSILLARHHHAKTGHQGRSTTLAILRQQGLWICGARKVISSMLRRCTVCIRMRGRPQQQKMADLPKDRVEEAPPFQNVGLDCFGPLIVKCGRKDVKRYGLILTCLASRAVHLEVLEDLSTDAFINGLRRFIAIRGTVRSIRCDRGTNFVGAKKEFERAVREMDEGRIKQELLTRSCTFQFNPPSASHFGGVWERLIRTVRNILTGLLACQTSRLDTAMLSTLLYEVMAIMNSRPLAIETLEDPEALSPLTPNHLLTLRPNPMLPPPGKFLPPDQYSKKRWRRIQFLVEQFWGRWRTEYLNTLQPRKKWYQEKDSVKAGDVVIVADDNAARGEWRLARVEETYLSNDGLVRSVKLRMPTQDLDRRGRARSKPTFLDRPVHKIVPLKC